MMRRISLCALLFLSRAAAAKESPYPEVTIDPRFELLAVVHVLAGADKPLPGFSLDDSAYAAAVRAQFWPFRGHPAVKAYVQAWKSEPDEMALQRMMLGVSSPPELKPRSAQPLRPEEVELLKRLREFSSETRFVEFFSEHGVLYRGITEDVLKKMRAVDFVGLMEKYTGLKVDARYTIILCPLRQGSGGNMGHIACDDGGGYHIYGTLGSSADEAGARSFAVWARAFDIWHELGHTLLDGRLEEYPEMVHGTEALYAPISEQCYSSWAQCMREHLVQGLSLRMLSWAKEKSLVPEHELIPPHKPSLPYLEAVGESLKEYELHRDSYTTIETFYPAWLKVFSRLAEAKPIASKHAKPGNKSSEIEPASSACRSNQEDRGAVPPVEPAKTEPKTAEDFKQRGVWRFLHGELEGALGDFMAARRLAPDDAETELNCSVVLDRQGRTQEAMKSADLAVSLALKPDGRRSLLAAEALSSRAALWQELKRRDKAREDLTRALKAAPNGWARRSEVERELSGP